MRPSLRSLILPALVACAGCTRSWPSTARRCRWPRTSRTGRPRWTPRGATSRRCTTTARPPTARCRRWPGWWSPTWCSTPSCWWSRSGVA